MPMPLTWMKTGHRGLLGEREVPVVAATGEVGRERVDRRIVLGLLAGARRMGDEGQDPQSEPPRPLAQSADDAIEVWDRPAVRG